MLRNYTPKFGSDVGANHQFAVNPFLVSAEERVSLKFKPRLFGPIESTEDFLYTLEVLENATENDEVELHINSGGGDLSAVSTLIHAMQKCVAPIHIVVTGVCASAATFPLFFSDNFEMSDYTSILIHEAIVGQPMETLSAAKSYQAHTNDFVEFVLRDVYKTFFTEEEYQQLFSGKQWWMRPDEFVERYKRMTQTTDGYQEGQDLMEEPPSVPEFYPTQEEIEAMQDEAVHNALTTACDCISCRTTA